MFSERSVVEVMVLVFTFTASLTMLLVGAFLAIVELSDPTADTSVVTTALLNLVSGVIGALLGLLAGKAEGMNALSARPEHQLGSVIPAPDPLQTNMVTEPPTSPTS